MKINKREYSRTECMRRLGSLAQIGGIQYLTVNDGPARGVRLLEFRLGSGFVFKVALDRGMDVGYCEYRGMPLGWIPPTKLPGGWFFEQQTEFGWLRTAMGGLCNSCGLLHIGNPESASIAHYHFPGREEERYGVHDRMAMLSAELNEYGESWEEDEVILRARGTLIQAQVYAENLMMTRSYTARLGEKRFFIRDEVYNQGHFPTPHMLLYHLNFGFPFVDSNSILEGKIAQYESLVNTANNGNPIDPTIFSSPQAGADLQVYELFMDPSDNGYASIIIYNSELGDMGMGVYVRYKPNQLPRLFETRMMGEGHYFVSIEPSTNGFDRKELTQKGELQFLKPGESKVYELEIGVLDGSEELNEFKITSINNTRK